MRVPRRALRGLDALASTGCSPCYSLLTGRIAQSRLQIDRLNRQSVIDLSEIARVRGEEGTGRLISLIDPTPGESPKPKNRAQEASFSPAVMPRVRMPSETVGIKGIIWPGAALDRVYQSPVVIAGFTRTRGSRPRMRPAGVRPPSMLNSGCWTVADLTDRCFSQPRPACRGFEPWRAATRPSDRKTAPG
jgi:hypothetical protein